MAKPTNPSVLLAWGDDLLLIEEAVDALAQSLADGGMGAPDRVRLKAEGRGAGDGAAVLSARGLAKSYGDTPVFSRIDLDLAAGEIVALLGESGSGKSTLLNILGGLDTPSAGEVFFHDHNLTAAGDAELVERERHAIAIHEACHAIAAYRLQKDYLIDIATIEKGGTYLGMVSFVKADDHYTQWKSDYESDIMVSLASLAGERMFFENDNSSGVSGDLMSATTLSALMEATWGMGTTISSQAAPDFFSTSHGRNDQEE